MGKLAELRRELAQSRSDLSTCHEMLAIAPDDPDAKETIPILEANIADLIEKIAAEEAKMQAAATSQLASEATEDNKPKYDMSKHPKFLKTSSEAVPPPPPASEPPLVLHVGAAVMAKYSADKQWYPATIISKTGSSADPVYGVMFKGYGNTETNKRQYEIRPMENNSTTSKKRKADGASAVTKDAEVDSSAAPPKLKPQTGTVISAAPAVDPTLVQKREPSKVSDGPTRMAPEPKKLKGNKALEKSKNSWNAWQQSGPKKGGVLGAAKMNRDSQFRTPDLPNAKVGFTGSGKPMQKDQARAKWNYGSDNHLEE